MICQNINTGCHGTVFCVAMVFEALNQKRLMPNQHVLHDCVGYFLNVVTVMIIVERFTESVSRAKLHTETQTDRRFPYAHCVTTVGRRRRNDPRQHIL